MLFIYFYFILEAIAKHLAYIENAIKELQSSQNEILLRTRCSTYTTPLEILIPDNITLPCDDNEALNKLENWILIEENSKHLVKYLPFLFYLVHNIMLARYLKYCRF